jgi:NADPH:quinone reductase-like Zn-dependent oxidoreductase
MRAVVYGSVGAPEVIEVAEVELPEPGMFEIRIKVDAAALNPASATASAAIGSCFKVSDVRVRR